jgi:uncharacterized protein
MPNALIHEKSPYLLQHAQNPVDWYPWGATAFAKARNEGKPIFLSVGYATCHWCHVMEKESFEEPQAAAALNDAFVCIKVDREERPDIDALYMTACQLVNGRGGWPLTIVMTPDKKPFYAGTYLPRTSRFGRLGLMEMCAQIKALWQNDPQRVHEAAEEIIGRLDHAFVYPADQAQELDIQVLDQAYTQIARSYDPQYGGFDKAPKFPTPHRLMLLLRTHHRTGDAHALEMVTHTLKAMRQGGLWDHVGFGFHRYATDGQWLLPHFEKMLYDQALLAMAYLEAYQVTGDGVFSQTAREIFSYVLRDMTSDQGAFWTAEDADSEGEEGKFYLWSLEAFEAIATAGDTEIPWHRIFNLHGSGNFHDEAGGQMSGANILHMTRTWEQWQQTLKGTGPELAAAWERLREKLFAQRQLRPAPLKDDKVLTDWNGLMVAALALGARVLGSDGYAAAAHKALAFIQGHLKDSQGRLLHRFRDGQGAIAAQASDYAFLIMGMIELYRTTFQTDLLQGALGLQAQLDAHFWDAGQGGYFSTAADDVDLPVRPKELYDGAMPSVNSVALSNLILLGRLTGDPQWDARAHELTQAFTVSVARQPVAFTHFLNGLDMAFSTEKTAPAMLR